MENINEIIRNVRRGKGMTQRQFAEAIGSTRECVAKYETSRATIPGPVLMRVLRLGKLLRLARPIKTR